MKKSLTCLLGVLSVAVGAWGADFITATSHGKSSRTKPRPEQKDSATLELGWDNGSLSYLFAWNRPRGGWRAGNDFDTSTLKTKYVKILKMKIFSSDLWPNAGWDGIGVCFFNFYRGYPGEMIWPSSGAPYFFKPTGAHGHVWVECEINWNCPTQAFVAANEQLYAYPDCDPFAVDNNETWLGHSWQYSYSYWSGLSLPYRNLMLRVIVETGFAFPRVAPTSLGRVKALYY